MATKYSVLQALKILGPEEILKLSEVLKFNQIALKQAAGGEYIVSEKVVKENFSKSPHQSAKVIPFPGKSSQPFEKVELNERLEVYSPASTAGSTKELVEPDIFLWQRDLARSNEITFQKHEAFNGYKKAIEIYPVKTQDLDGKEKVRFADTKGILINKKQA